MPTDDTVLEPARELSVLARADVVVAGGGTAGVAAAVAAAREGAQVVLLERGGVLGGLATGGLIALLLTLDDGRGRQVIGGLCQEIVDRVGAAGGEFHPPAAHWASSEAGLVEKYRRWGLVWGKDAPVRYSVAYDPEILAQVLAEMVVEAGVDLLFHCLAADPLVEGRRIEALAVQSKAGRGAVVAPVYIDASGDGELFAAAGCAFELERVHPWLWFRVGGITDVSDALEQGAPFFRTTAADQVLVPWGLAARGGGKIDATDPRERTRGELDARRLALEEFRRLRVELPDAAGAHLCGVASQLGITESRRVAGRATLTRQQADRDFADAIAVTGHWTRHGLVYAVPYGCLLAAELDNLLVAGRCISVDHPTHNATKEIPACVATGQAAGTAAAMAAAASTTGGQQGDASAVDTGALRVKLAERGALLEYPFAARAGE
jgi:hypothetical protein